MSIISIRFELADNTPYSINLDGYTVVEHSQKKLEFNSHVLKDHQTHALDIVGDVTVERLCLDGIDTDYFVHHGFTSNGTRGNTDTQRVRYYFRTPVWRWLLEWKQHDNSTFRQLSKDHSGFLPL